jgi:GTPase SAR1 family protein
MENTMDYMIGGLSEWALQGLFYSATHQLKADRVVIDDDFSLAALYESNTYKTELALNIHKQANNLRRIYDKGYSEYSEEVHEKTLEQADRLGMDIEVEVVTNQLDENCERETEREMQIQQESEVELESLQPYAEAAWNYEIVTTARSINDLLSCVHVEHISSFAFIFLVISTC